MSENCTHDCENCSAGCDHASPQSFLENPHPQSDIRRVIGVMSGKGGVGKSLVTSLLASEMQRRGYKAAILDADITGPSIPKMFGITGHAGGDESGIYPVKSEKGIDVMSINLLLENATDPVIWRGPVIAGTVRQFWTDVIWADVDYMFVDMPPGTGDVPLTVFQSLPLDGLIVVTSPQELVGMIVGKAVKMAELLNIPILGVAENMSYFACPDCGKKHLIFGDSHLSDVLSDYQIDTFARIPISPALAAASDAGTIEDADASFLDPLADKIEKTVKISEKN